MLTQSVTETEVAVLSPVRKIAVIDSDENWLGHVVRLFSNHKHIRVYPYKYPIDVEKFRKGYDVIMVSLKLGGLNGANVVSNLFRICTEAKMMILVDGADERTKEFKSCMSRDELEKNPASVFERCDKIGHVDQAIETVMMLQWNKF